MQAHGMHSYKLMLQMRFTHLMQTCHKALWPGAMQERKTIPSQPQCKSASAERKRKTLKLQQAVNNIIPDVWRLLTRLACSLAGCRIQPDCIH